MCIFDCCQRSTNHRIFINLNRYQTYDCEKCRNQQKLENFQFCGMFSIFYLNQKEFDSHLSTYLIKLQGKSKYIQCVKCRQKLFLDQKDNHLFVSKFSCNHSQQKVTKQCICCKYLIQKKQYQKCKKCQLSLLFFDSRRKVKCPMCNLVCCEICKEEIQLFSKQICNCKIIRYSKDVQFYQFLIFIIIFLIIFAFVGSFYLEDSEFYQSMICTIKDGYSNVNCTLEQFYKDTFKQFIIFIGFNLLMSLVIALIEIIKLFLKTQRRLRRAKSSRYR